MYQHVPYFQSRSLSISTISLFTLFFCITLMLPAQRVNLDQGKNGGVDAPPIDPVEWINGNLNGNKSHFMEGNSVPYQVVMKQLPINGTEVCIDFEYDIKKNGRYALDFITGYQNIDETVDPLLSSPLAGQGLTESTYEIPSPPSIMHDGAMQPATRFNDLPESVRQIGLWGGTINSMTYRDPDDVDEELDPSDPADQARIQEIFQKNTASLKFRVCFTPSQRKAVLAFGGHIAMKQVWGEGASASSINGSPYHMAICGWNLSNLGQQDRSLKTDAIIEKEEGGEECIYKGYEFDYNASTGERGEKFAFLIEAPTQVGLTPSNWYGWETHGELKIAPDGQSAELTGNIVNIDKNAFGNFFPGNPDVKFEARVKFVLLFDNAKNYLKAEGVDVDDPDALRAALGTYIKYPWQYEDQVLANLENMKLWDIDPAHSTLTSIGECAGDVLTLSRRTDGGADKLLVQYGEYANDKDADFGIGVWIYTTGTLCGQQLQESPHPYTGDINIDLHFDKCVDTEPCIPPEIYDFSAKYTEGEVKLKWKTSHPELNDELVFEKSIDGNVFEVLGTGSEMPPIIGTHGFFRTYDENPPKDGAYYRIRFMCPSGEMTYSKVVEIKPPSEKPCITVSPNPQKCGKPVWVELCNMEPNKEMRLYVVGMRGCRLARMRVRTDNHGNLKMKLPFHLRVGMYQVGVQSGRQRMSQRLIIIP